jgi:polysaccharide pyruvyl transferase WcaK-like protein
MVNSDQTWRKFGDKFFYDHGFLRFARKWNITKFVYGASLGYNHWKLTKNDEIIIKNLLTNFKGLSVREKGSIELIQKHLGFKPILVLDPTLLIDKKYYLNLLKDYKGAKPTNNNYIFTYLIIAEKNIRTFIKNASEELDYEIFNVYKSDNNSIIKFIYGVVHSKAVITDSYHGTIFSIIFNKPFISILFKGCPKERFISLGEIFNVKERIFESNEMPNINLLTTPLNINSSYISLLKKQSLSFLKQNLKIV